MPQKTTSMKIEDFKNNLVGVINKSELPPFIISPILKDALDNVQKAERQLLENDIKNYQAELGKENIKENNNKEGVTENE